jgi:hypothetical protein
VSRLGTATRTASAGAALMYFLDPEVGRRRRALVRDQLVHWTLQARDEVATELRDVAHRVQGMLAVAQRALIGTGEAVADPVLAERVRARLGVLDHPGGITVRAEDGRVHLGGRVLGYEAERARQIAGRTRGVRVVLDELEMHSDPGQIPTLQGRPRRRDVGQLEPATRLALGTTAILGLAPLLRTVPPGLALRLVTLGGLVAAVASVERACLRAIARSRAAAALPVRPPVETD